MKNFARRLGPLFHKKQIRPSSEASHEQFSFSEAERLRLLIEWNDTYAAYPEDLCIHQLFAEQAARTPDAQAVVAGTRSLTYRQLNEQANRLAHYLQTLHIGPDQLVGICLERSLDMIVAVLAVLKAGGAYVPLDPVYPPERLSFMLQDSRASVLLTHQHLHLLSEQKTLRICLDRSEDQQRIAQCSSMNPSSAVRPHHLAYVIYTSGSTGVPKGVAIEHRSLVNHGCAFREYAHLQAADRILQFASLSFDTAAEEIFPTLISGATLVLRPEFSDTLTFWNFVADAQLTVLNLPTAYWSLLTAQLAERSAPLPPRLRTVVVGGERATLKSFRLWQQWTGGRITWINGYGPTEATITATLYTAPGAEDGTIDETVPIGRPIANAQMYVLDEALRPTPIGVPGELYIAGKCLARGYLYREELTRERFLPCPFSKEPGARMYKTGDLVRYRSDGHLEYIGRIDQQVKIRGFRIELGEIEAALGQHPDVQACVVAALDDAQENKQLVAYVVAKTASQPTIGTVRAFLKERLPDYMLPSALVCLAEFPLTPNGKVDYKALPGPESVRTAKPHATTPPGTPVEKRLVEIAAPLLGLEQESISTDDNFFLLGGNSLMGIQFVAQIADAFGIEFPLRTLFEKPTVQLLAQAIEQIILTRIAEMDENEARSLLEEATGMV
jgi:amino acid adenylation domain-containing protein